MDDPETIRQRGLDDAAETLHYLRQRQEEHEQRLPAPQGRVGEPEGAPPAPEPAKPVHRTTASLERAQPAAAGVDWQATEVWVRGIVGRHVSARLEAFAGVVGEATAVMAKKERARLRGEFNAALDALRTELRAEIAAERAAKAAEARYAALEARLIEAELRTVPKPAAPRLVGGSADAAD